VIKPLQFNDHTAQTNGMHRLAAVSGLLAGSEKLWAGVMLTAPNTASSVHHHGEQETVVYVAEGKSLLRWGHRLEHESELEAGDFLLIPPYLPHQEINPSPDHPAMWIVVRSGPEAIAIDLTPNADGEYVPLGSSAIKQSDSTDGAMRTMRRSDRTQSISVTLLAMSVVVFVGAVVSGVWLLKGGRDGMALLLIAVLALIGVIDIVWAFHARSARRFAILDAYAEREIERMSVRKGTS
jgi:uncharacterized RmlC-like cupin family protein